MKLMLSVVLTVVFAATAFSHNPAGEKKPTGVRADILRELNEAEKKIVGLAEVTPADKFGWRPAEGVRSIGEAYLHIAGGNYLLVSLIGVKVPEGVDLKTIERNGTEKAEVIRRLRASFEHARKAITGTGEQRLQQKAKFFGQDSTVRGILLSLPVHASEHLGQSIAYARMNGIVPPWSASGN